MGRSGIRRRRPRTPLSEFEGATAPLPRPEEHRSISPLAEVYAAHDIAQAWSRGDRRTRRRAAIAAAILGLPVLLAVGFAIVTLVARILGGS